MFLRHLMAYHDIVIPPHLFTNFNPGKNIKQNQLGKKAPIQVRGFSLISRTISQIISKDFFVQQGESRGATKNDT